MWRQRLFLAIACVLSLPVFVKAQRVSYAKMSPFVREAYLSSRIANSFNAKAFGKNNRKKKTITAFVKATDRQALSGCGVFAQFGDLYIASIPIERLGWLSSQTDVKRIEAGRCPHATMDTTSLIIGATALHDAVAFPMSYTGKGVVIGVQDLGFDLTHPNFWSADMSRYRIKALWDQLSTDTLGSRLPVGRDYRDSLSLLSLGRPRDGDIQTHGTHTAGIAAGSGAEGVNSQSTFGRYAGIAPDADLCLVCNATTDDIDLIDSADYYKYTFALDALGFKYIFDYADSVGKPCVINFSEGSQEDLQGNDQLYYEMLDSLVGPGHIIVASAGNEGGQTNYLYKPATVDSAEIGITGAWHAESAGFTTRSNGNMRIRLLAGNNIVLDIPLDSVLAAQDSTLTDSFNIAGKSYGFAVAAYDDSYGTGRIATDWVLTSSDYIYPTTFRMQILSSEDVELFVGTALLSSVDDGTENQHGVVVNNSHSILSPGSAPGVICVGMTGYRTSFTNYLGKVMDFGGSSNGAINPYSSVGPTFDGRLKPDVVAPGQNIISSYSSYYIAANPNASDASSCVRRFDYGGRTYAWYSNMGTSMSAPVVTGVIALWLQANPRLTPRDCLDIIAKTSTHPDESITYPNNVYGYGQIDAVAGMRLVQEMATGIKAVKRARNNKVYSIDGRYMGTDLHSLPKGIYIVNNRKVCL